MVSDTHLRAGQADRLPVAVRAAAEQVEVILHAGDVTSVELLDELRSLAPLHAVLGNNDTDLTGVLPERVVVDLDGVTVAMVHDAGPRKGRPGRLARWFPTADLVVFGHSHEPVVERDGDRWLLNPGSPTQRRRQPHPTYALVELTQGTVGRVEVVALR